MLANNNAAAVCCGGCASGAGCVSGRANGGGVNGNLGLSLGASPTTIRSAPGDGLIKRIEDALTAAIHGGDSVSGAGGGSANDSGIAQGGSVIDFPMINPYSPIKATGSPVTGINAYPWPQSNLQPARNKRVSKIIFKEVSQPGIRISNFNTRGNEDAPSGMPGEVGSESLGFAFEEYPNGVSLPSSGPSNLQSILSTIATTLPATISALKKQPYYNPAQGQQAIYGQQPYGVQPGVTQGGIANIGAQTGAAVGNLGDAFSNIVATHPYLILAGGAALLLLFMKPPSRRR